MVPRETKELVRLIRTAQGRRPASLVLRRGKLVNVFTGEIERADLAIAGDRIAGWGDYEGEQEMDLDGMYVAPGFIDAHIHLESTLLDPARFCAAVLRWGTCAVVADPHEIANVHGLDGIRYFLQAAEKLPLDLFFMLPSCVPASPLETSGASLSAVDLFTLADHPRVLGLAEMMNFPGVLSADQEVIAKLSLFQDRCLDGHAPLLSGTALNAYISAGIDSDHECTQAAEAREKLAKGMYVMIREGSQSKNLQALWPVVTDSGWPRCMFATDDRHPDDLLRDGHMNAIVNKAMELGMEPVRALTLACRTAAERFQLQRRGALAPGYLADFSVSPTLRPWRPVRVFKNGIEVARDGKLLLDPASFSPPPPPPSPMAMPPIEARHLAVSSQPGQLKVIGVREGSLLTRKLLLDPKVEDGRVVADPDRDLLKLVVINRYRGRNSEPAMARGFIQGLGLRRGAIASTVAHDAHNLIAAGASDIALIRAIEAVRRTGGAMAVATEDGAPLCLPLPIAGLMSDQPVEWVGEQLARLKRRTAELGSPLQNPFMALSFMALSVIPELKLTDRGLVDVSTFSFTPLFEKP